MKKRLLAAMLTLCMGFTLLPMSALAEEIVSEPTEEQEDQIVEQIPEETPAVVQAFLAAVAKLPAAEDITAENQAEVEELCYGEAADALEAILGTEYEDYAGVADAMAVMEAVAAKLDALDGAVLLDNEETTAAASVYVSSSGSDENGDGTEGSPYASLAKAVDAVARNGTATIYVMSDLTVTDIVYIYEKNITITSADSEKPVTITRDEKMRTHTEPARKTYNPAMIEVAGTPGGSEAVSFLTLKNITLDDGGKKMGTHYVQADSEGDGKTVIGSSEVENTEIVQDAIIATYNGVGTITLGEGTTLKNFGGMSAVRLSEGTLIMESGSKICDDGTITRTKQSGDFGAAGAIWSQGGTITMEQGSEIFNIKGRAIYMDTGTATISGEITNITPDKDNAWQSADGYVIHLRGNDVNNAEATLTSTAVIDNNNITATGYAIKVLATCKLTAENGSVIKNVNNSVISVTGDKSVVDFDGEMTGKTGKGQAINIQDGNFYVKIGPNANIHHNVTSYGTIYIQMGKESGKMDVYGKINDNTNDDHGGGIAQANNGTRTTINMYDGAEICRNSAKDSGGGVMVSNGVFNMYGGTISGNICTKEGAGVLVRRGGYFNMYGGTISDNVTATIGGGIAFDASDIGNPSVAAYANIEGGTITGNLMGATLTKGEDGTYTTSGGTSNDIAVTSTDYGHINRYLKVADAATLGNKEIYFATNDKTVTATWGTELGNASNGSITNLKNESVTNKQWSEPLATFWAQKDTAVDFIVGGLKLKDNLPVYVLTQKTDADGQPVTDADVNVYAATVDNGNVIFTLPAADTSGNGCAIAIVQPTTDYGTLTLTGTQTIKEGDTPYVVDYNAVYTLSDNLKNQNLDKNQLTITIQLDANTTYQNNSIPEKINENFSQAVTYDKEENTLEIDLVLTEEGKIPNKIEFAFKAGVTEFTAGGTLDASGVVTATVTSSGTETPVVVPSNVWTTEMTALKTCTVTFNSNGGSSVENQSVKEGGMVTKPTNPTREGYTFTGWTLNGSAYDFSKLVTSDITLVAQWSKNSTPVTPSSGDSSSGGDSGYAPGEGPLANKTDAELDKERHEAYVYGYPDGTVQPTNNITREEVATIFFRLLTDNSRAKYITSENPFPDVENDRWSHWSITTLNNAGIMTGRDNGNFDPAAPITRAELAVVASQFSQAVYNGEDKFSDITNHWAKDYINEAASEGWVSGYPDGTFGPDRYITRAEVMALINEVLERMPDADNMLSSMIDWPDNPESAWYYEDVQEATNSHDYNWITNSSNKKTGEDWVKIIDIRPYADLVNDALNG